MGDSITEGSVAAVLKQAGDAVETDEVVAQIETDKVTIDVRAPSAGTVSAVLVKDGDTVVVGQGVIDLEEATGGAPAVSATHATSAPAPVAEPVTIEVPSMGESITEGAVAALMKQPGSACETDEVIAQIETDKVTIDVRVPSAGVLESFAVAEGDTVTVGQPFALFAPGAATASVPAAAPLPSAATAAKVDVPPVPPVPTPKPTAPAAPSTAAPAPASGRQERRVAMTRLRKRVSDRLKGSQNTYAMLSTFNEVDMSALMALRTEYKDVFLEKHGAKLGFMSAFVKASADALQMIPAVNGVIDGDDILYRDYCDISIAVGTSKGLVVPVLRDVDRMSFADVEKAIAMYGKKARDGTLGIDEMTGGTFTISNGGVYGSLLSTPIINPPQSAILGMHAIVNRPVCIGKEIVARPMMNLALTYDHRLIDGREAVTFLKRVKDIVEDPRRLLLDC